MPSKKLENQTCFPLKLFKTSKMPLHSSAEPLQSPEVPPETGGLRSVKLKEWIIVFILCFINLINYMDRFTLAGILVDIQDFYKIGDENAGLLQTAFVVSYMIFAPLFGYLGDRFSRRWIMAAGVFLWSLTTLCGSFMNHFSFAILYCFMWVPSIRILQNPITTIESLFSKHEKNFWWFLAFRGMVGIGEASYSTIAPTIISDLFVSDVRSKMLAFFYFAIPVGSGMGYIIGSETAKLAQQWQWALRVTPVLGVIAVLLIIFVLVDPERGQSEGSAHLEPTPWSEDVKDIVQNKSFMFSTAGFTCVAFVAGALSWWGPSFIQAGIKLQGNGDNDSESTAFIFGLVSMISGIIGVPAGSMLAQRLRPQYPNCDANICAVALLFSAPMVFFACITVPYSTFWCFFFVFLAEVSLNLTWALVADILLYVVLPTRRSTAEGFQLLVSHALGDAGSPYLIGVMSEAFKIMLNDRTGSKSDENDYHALQYALFSTCFVEVIGGIFFFITALYVIQDKRKVEKAVHDNSRRLLADQEADPIIS